MKNVGLLWRKTSTDLSGDQIVPDRKPDEFREVRQFQFVHDVVTVSLDCASGDSQSCRDLLVAIPFGEHPQDFGFPR